MPIQFRCSSCKQLLGIARRKAGASVTCPTCGAKTLVPEEAAAVAVGAAEKAAPKPAPVGRKRVAGNFSLLERVDVDELLKAPDAPPTGQHDEPQFVGAADVGDSAKTAALDSSEEPAMQRIVPPRKSPVPGAAKNPRKWPVVLIAVTAVLAAVGLLAAGWYLGRRGP